jgi:hypothetical protein
MHGLSVAGKLTDISYDDADKSIEVCAKVVDDAEWNKVVEGCYTGFSVGGKYGKKWKETVDGETITKFTAVPNEVSWSTIRASSPLPSCSRRPTVPKSLMLSPMLLRPSIRRKMTIAARVTAEAKRSRRLCRRRSRRSRGR